MARNVFNLGKAISQGYAWTREGQKIIINEVKIGNHLYPIIGSIYSKKGVLEARRTWTITGRWKYRQSNPWDLTTKEP